MPKMWLLTCISLVATLVLVAGVVLSWPDDKTHVVFCDVGQGDAILITVGFVQVLVDSGRDSAVLGCLAQYMPWWDQTIEAVVMTHADADHIGGFPAVLKRYQIKAALLDAVGKDSEDFLSLRTALLDEVEGGAVLLQPFLGQVFMLNRQTRIITLSPRVAIGSSQLFEPTLSETELSAVLKNQEAAINSYNDGSIVLLVEIGQVEMLLTGDLEATGEQALLRQGLITDVDVLKVGHHGSKTSSTPGFIAQTRPEISIISSGKNNTYGHPAASVLELLEERKSQILRTDQMGHLNLISDGHQYWFGDLKQKLVKEQVPSL